MGTSILFCSLRLTVFASTQQYLTHRQGSFAETYQRAAYEADLPIIVFGVTNVDVEIARLATAGVKLRPDLDRPEHGLRNMFEDGCGNLIMIDERLP